MAMLLEQDGNPRCQIETGDARSPTVPVDDGSPNQSNDLEGQNCDNKVIQCHNLNTAKQNDNLGVSDCSKRDKSWKGSAEKFQDNDTKFDDASARSRALQQAVSHGVRQAQLHLQHAQPQQTSLIRWERFLPQHQLRVLLVEDDDATRHVVSALLRNCSYEVTSASNGLIAWEFLMDQNSKVDLVLTEVVMPCLSGIGLLARITSHEPIKHIPVIMMSSHDSMGVVFKCLSNGAVDFLVKPVRKNELKNLWQHVWRRCQSSSGSGSGSGSESGSQNQIIVPPEAAGEANNSISNDESDNASSELNIGGGSDNGSGTQSSWTRKAVEVESLLQSAPDGLMLQLKSGCIPEAVHQKGKKNVDSNEGESQVGVPELILFPKDNTHADSQHPTQEILAGTTVLGGDSRDHDVCAGDAPFVDNWQKATLVSETPTKDMKIKQEQQAESEDVDEFGEKHASNSPSLKDKMLSDSSSPSLLKCILKRPRQENDREHEVRGGLKHSCSSAFSRYQNSGNINMSSGKDIKIYPPPTPFGDHSFVQGSSVGSSHPQSIPFRSQAARTPYSKGLNDKVMAPPYYRAACTKEDTLPLAIESGTKVHFPSPTVVFNGFGTSNNEPVSNPSLPSHWGPSAEKVEGSEYHGSLSQGHHEVLTNHQDTQAHHHAYHHHHHHHHIQHHYHHLQDQPRPQTPQQEDSTLVCGTVAPKCGSSNMGKGGEGNNGQCGSNNGYGSTGNGAVSLNGSASGSNNGSNGGQSTAAELTGAGNVEDNMQQPVGGSGVTVAQHASLDLDQSRHARREAALNKFRQKRKERCFEKKVRYQSRKRLAEQRPRVRGQFVRQSVK